MVGAGGAAAAGPDTPGSGWWLRCNDKKFIEDGKFEIAVGPYTEGDPGTNDVVVGGGWAR